MKKRVLLIEDDYLDVESVKRVFKKMNIDVDLTVAHNGVDGLSLLNSSTPEGNKAMPDVIILDINMPKMNGIEFLEIIKNYYSLKKIRKFILTTSSDEYDKIATDALGVDGYILKPLSFKDPKSKAALQLLNELLSE